MEWGPQKLFSNIYVPLTLYMVSEALLPRLMQFYAGFGNARLFLLSLKLSPGGLCEER
jgi:hypothetical protein